MTGISASTHLAREVLLALVRAGVTDLVLAPGSRNAPLSFAAFDAERAGLARLHVRIDERSAGFLALGLTKAGARAAVMCTSGTAVANLHPALLEAAHGGVPLVAVTADRPARLRGTSANQTTDQVGIFGPLIPTTDLASAADLAEGVDELREAFRARRPVHWNAQFDNPLTPEGRWEPGPVEALPPLLIPEPRIFETIDAGPGTVVVAGDGAGPSAVALAEAAGWPLFAEPSSNARLGPNALMHYRGLDLSEVRRAVVFGHPTLSRSIARLLARVEVWQGPTTGVWREPDHPVARFFRTTLGVTGEPDPHWLGEWQRRAVEATRRDVEHVDLAQHAAAAAWTEAEILVVGPSNPVRDLDLVADPRHAPERVYASRGLAGIDGVVSTAIGVALAEGRPTVALLGDVTFLHDSNGLILGPEEPRPDLQIVVVNDDGGSIFATLEQGAAEYAAPEWGGVFERVFGTPHGVDVAALCAATRTPHLKVESLAELRQALTNPNGGIEVVEVKATRDWRHPG